jgi:hypothetical protein
MDGARKSTAKEKMIQGCLLRDVRDIDPALNEWDRLPPISAKNAEKDGARKSTAKEKML